MSWKHERKTESVMSVENKSQRTEDISSSPLYKYAAPRVRQTLDTLIFIAFPRRP